MKIVLPVFYLPPISWFSIFFDDDNEILLEQFENYPKQTYRNRAQIYGANGKLALIIPISHNSKRTYKEIEISYAENWQKQHWKSIKTAYQSSPYFEFYEDRLETIYQLDTPNLLDFNLNLLEILQSILKTQKTFQLTTQYKEYTKPEDFRSKFSSKQNSDFQMSEYYQTFSEKFGFIKDLSVLDLICNKGPESLSYIKNLKLSSI